ncbi:unnamed protein product [Brassicogethes aeneus]|uniref:Uncharacterized protein n=1 Tax=Brassicogethes aeneus TaxID=1431903 RepID=A0A9P0FME9_BRAAE|nr:unnamed protein product [Brassicogethes aeneus]
MTNTLQMLRNRFLWPSKANELDPPRKFYYVAAVMAGISLISFNGSFFHFISQLTKKNYDNVDMDAASIISLTGIYFSVFFFLVKIKRLSLIYQKMSDFATYGKPPNFEKDNETLNFYSKLFSMYMFCLIVSVSLPDLGECKNAKAEKRTFSMDALTLFIGWFIALALVASGGQRIIDEVY